MSRVLTFSHVFPQSHPRAGEKTNFPEKIWKWYFNAHNGDVRDLNWYLEQYDNHFGVDAIENVQGFAPKLHTIRSGRRWKVGDFFSPRIWSGKPYASKQIIIAPDIEIKNVYDFSIATDGDYACYYFDSEIFFEHNDQFITQYAALEFLAKNDGLSVADFLSWFNYPKPFDGQIICWETDIYPV